MLAGLSYATRGDWAATIEACRRGLEISPDAFETAFILAWLGEAYFLGGQMDRAREVVGQALEICTDVNYLVGLGWCHQLLGRIAQA